jgi:uncharacterized membrane protein YciS (DUF1049 family)
MRVIGQMVALVALFHAEPNQGGCIDKMHCMNQIPILSQLVTFLHELGHAMAAMATGGHVLALQVNLDGSGFCTTSGGSRALVLCGGYVGSVLFGNIMLYVGIHYKFLSRIFSAGMAFGMVLVSLMWFSTLISFAFTFLVGGLLLFLFMKVAWAGRAFMIIAGAYSILYVLHDYRIGPSSDLQAFASVMGLTPLLWMYIWLGIAVAITGGFLFLTMKGKN